MKIKCNYNFSLADATIKTLIEIERSFDGHSFSTISEIKVVADAATGSYSYTDFGANQGNHNAWYRLKIISPGGKSLTSEIVSVKLSEIKDWSFDLFPNPAKQYSNISIASTARETINVLLKNSVGQTVATEKKNVIQGTNNFHLNTQLLPAGIYYVEVQSKSQRLVRKLLVH